MKFLMVFVLFFLQVKCDRQIILIRLSRVRSTEPQRYLITRNSEQNRYDKSIATLALIRAVAQKTPIKIEINRVGVFQRDRSILQRRFFVS